MITSNWTCTAWSCALPTAGWWNRGRWRGWRESIERCGQIVPCVVVAAPESQGGEGGGAQALVLIDGYRRVSALLRLGRDTVSVEQWGCDLTSALLLVLARDAGWCVRQH